FKSPGAHHYVILYPWLFRPGWDNPHLPPYISRYTRASPKKGLIGRRAWRSGAGEQSSKIVGANNGLKRKCRVRSARGLGSRNFGWQQEYSYRAGPDARKWRN